MYFVNITDKFPACPGTVQIGPYATLAEAKIAGDRELEAAALVFTDGRADLTVEIIFSKKGGAK